MWPIMTLTLLLQLTNEEQLYAQGLEPAVLPQAEGQVIQTPAVAPEKTCAEWPEAATPEC